MWIREGNLDFYIKFIILKFHGTAKIRGDTNSFKMKRETYNVI